MKEKERSGIAPKIRAEFEEIDEKFEELESAAGTAGPQGEPGEKGEAGPQGEKGEPGSNGLGISSLQLTVDEEGKVTRGKWKDTAGADHDIEIVPE